MPHRELSQVISWGEFSKREPDLARFGADRLTAAPAYLATIRRSGAPRVHPVTPIFEGAGLFLFMEPTSPKRRDLLERGFFALHSGVPDNEGTGGEFSVRALASLWTIHRSGPPWQPRGYTPPRPLRPVRVPPERGPMPRVRRRSAALDPAVVGRLRPWPVTAHVSPAAIFSATATTGKWMFPRGQVGKSELSATQDSLDPSGQVNSNNGGRMTTTAAAQTAEDRQVAGLPALEPVEGAVSGEEPGGKPSGPGQAHEEQDVEAERCRSVRGESEFADPGDHRAEHHQVEHQGADDRDQLDPVHPARRGGRISGGDPVQDEPENHDQQGVENAKEVAIESGAEPGREVDD